MRTLTGSAEELSLVSNSMVTSCDQLTLIYNPRILAKLIALFLGGLSKGCGRPLTIGGKLVKFHQ
jgi:hypothetical protein